MNDEEDVTAQLLRLSGPEDPSAERTARVRHVVHGEWMARRRRHTMRRGAAAAIAILGMAASVVVVVRVNRPRAEVVSTSNVVVATAGRIQGQPIVHREPWRDGDSRQLSLAVPVYANDVIETDNASRASLQMKDGSSLRIDRGSRVRVIQPAVIELTAGAAYVSTSEGSRGFEVRTAMGAVRDVGTQFEVRLSDSSLRLRVRTGRVEIRRGTNVTAAAAGTEATVTTGGIAVQPVAAYGSEWAWTADVAPTFAVEGRPLRAFLEYIAREEGWTLQYSDPGVADAAGRIIMHGSFDGLQPEEALGAALATSGLQFRLRDGQLLVSRPAGAR